MLHKRINWTEVLVDIAHLFEAMARFSKTHWHTDRRRSNRIEGWGRLAELVGPEKVVLDEVPKFDYGALTSRDGTPVPGGEGWEGTLDD